MAACSLEMVKSHAANYVYGFPKIEVCVWRGSLHKLPRSSGSKRRPSQVGYVSIAYRERSACAVRTTVHRTHGDMCEANARTAMCEEIGRETRECDESHCLRRIKKNKDRCRNPAGGIYSKFGNGWGHSKITHWY